MLRRLIGGLLFSAMMLGVSSGQDVRLYPLRPSTSTLIGFTTGVATTGLVAEAIATVNVPAGVMSQGSDYIGLEIDACFVNANNANSKVSDIRIGSMSTSLSPKTLNTANAYSCHHVLLYKTFTSGQDYLGGTLQLGSGISGFASGLATVSAIDYSQEVPIYAVGTTSGGAGDLTCLWLSVWVIRKP